MDIMSELMQEAASKDYKPTIRRPPSSLAHVRPRQLHADLSIGARRFKVRETSATEKWLSRKVSFQDPHEWELSKRIAAYWSAFTKHKSELTSNSVVGRTA